MNAKDIKEFRLPTYEEIPGVGLYLEQTQKFIAEYLDGYSSFSITSSMISNYVKKKLVDNPVKKQYSRDQIACLIFIAIVKSVLSLEDIQMLLTMQQTQWTIRESYGYFRQCMDDSLADRMDTSVEDENIARSLLQHITVTIAHKMQVDQTFVSLRDMENQ